MLSDKSEQPESQWSRVPYGLQGEMKGKDYMGKTGVYSEK